MKGIQLPEGGRVLLNPDPSPFDFAQGDPECIEGSGLVRLAEKPAPAVLFLRVSLNKDPSFALRTNLPNEKLRSFSRLIEFDKNIFLCYGGPIS